MWEQKMDEPREPPIPPVPDRPMEPPDFSGDLKRWSDRAVDLATYPPLVCEPGAVHRAGPVTFTTQRVPYLVHNALQRVIREIGMSLEVRGGFHTHMAVMIHPDDWRAFLDFMRQQGTLDESRGPLNIGSLELSGVTVLQDLGAKVPHLELVAE